MGLSDRELERLMAEAEASAAPPSLPARRVPETVYTRRIEPVTSGDLVEAADDPIGALAEIQRGNAPAAQQPVFQQTIHIHTAPPAARRGRGLLLAGGILMACSVPLACAFIPLAAMAFVVGLVLFIVGACL